MTVRSNKFDRKWEQAIAALLTARTIKQAAQDAGISEATILRWLKDADFQSAYAAAKSELLSATKNRLRVHALGFVGVLAEVATDEDAAPHARVSAAKAGLDLVMRIDEAEGLEARLEKLEEELRKSNR